MVTKKIMTRSASKTILMKKERSSSFAKKTHRTSLKVLRVDQLGDSRLKSPKKQKKTKWQLGIIVKQRQKTPKKRRRSQTRLIDKGIITRSVARRLIDKNMLDLDCGDLLVVKQQPIRTEILNDDVLKLILSYLPLKERFRAQRTSKQFHSVVREMLSEQRALRIGNCLIMS